MGNVGVVSSFRILSPSEATTDVMEQVERRLSFTGLTVDSDPSFRMQTRPLRTGIAPGAGKPREDFGTSGFKGSPRKSKLSKTGPASTQSTTILAGSNEEDDDLDLLDLSPGTWRLGKIRTTTASGSRDIIEGPTGATYKGEIHEYHPNYLPKPKLPKFKKNKSTNQTGDGGDNTSSRSDTPDQLQQSNPSSRNLPLVSKQARQVADKEIPPTPLPRLSQPPSSPPPKTRAKPRPQPTRKPPTRILRRVDSSDESGEPARDRAEEDGTLTGTKECPRPTKKQPTKSMQKEFPLLNDPSFQSDQPLRVVSDLSPSRSRGSSPETSPVRPHGVKGKGKVVVSDDDAEDCAGQAPQPFPLSTNFMNSTPKASKRHPEDQTHSGGSERKKLKETLSG